MRGQGKTWLLTKMQKWVELERVPAGKLSIKELKWLIKQKEKWLKMKTKYSKLFDKRERYDKMLKIIDDVYEKETE